MNTDLRRILIVDDEPNNLELMRNVLGNDYKLAFATCGNEALNAATKLTPDIILLDIMMPEMDGYETCRRLKAGEITRNIPVIFVTAKGDTEDETRGLELGAIDFLTKPIRPSIVKARIRNHLAMKIAQEEIASKNKILETQNTELMEAARLREDVERISRHDMKAPLNAVINFPRLMMNSKELPPKYIQYLEIIEQAGLDLLNMVNISLDIFKMERGMYELKPEKVDVLDSVNRIFNEFKEICDQKAISKVIRINGRLVNDQDRFFIQSEALLCYSMLANLIKNALEASPEKEQITVNIHDHSNKTAIEIHNNGAVPYNIRDRFFEKYVTAGKKSGSGLGTYSARLIAITHGGDIDLDTSEKTGTRVTVQIPHRDTADPVVSVF